MIGNDLLALFGTVLAVFTALASAIIWYTNYEKKRYGLERDFAHIKRNYEQLNENIKLMVTELDHRFDDIDKSLDYRCDAIDKTLIEIKSKFSK